MLINCPECKLQVSDKAINCPHCGFPMIDTSYTKIKKKNKRKRLPNGFGQISEIKNSALRKRFRVMITTGKTSTGRPIVRMLKPVAYFSTYNEAYAALVEYNRHPYDLDDDLTLQQLYDKWSPNYFEGLKSKSSVRTITSAWSHCSQIYDMRVKDIRSRHIKGCMDDVESPNIKSRIKSMFNIMLDYAVEHEIVDKNYARTFNISSQILDDKEASKRAHIPFTDEEINILWDNVDKKQYVDVLLIQCYSGWRPQELGLIKLENVDLENNLFQGGMKTKAGMDRIVPIHPKIRHLVERKYKEALELGSEYLINCTDTNTHKSSYVMTYDKYQKRFVKIKNELGLNSEHRAHDGRVHFVTLAKKYKVDEYAIKYIIGHAIQDLTERVYTQRDIDWLQSEMLKIM